MSSLHAHIAGVCAKLREYECPNCAMDIAHISKTTVVDRRGRPILTRTTVHYRCDHCKAEYDEWGTEIDKDGWVIDATLNPRKGEDPTDGE
jgi:DNA-directed RNA polymerase subunit RPC12/RpoP